MASSGSVKMNVPHSGPCASQAAQQAATVDACTFTMPPGITVAFGQECPGLTAILHVPGGGAGGGGGDGGDGGLGGNGGPPRLTPVVFLSLWA